jgi:hypothetical protein
MYRRGMFNDAFSFSEFKLVIRVIIFMHLIDLAGHAMFKYMTRPVVDKYVGENQMAMLGKRKQFMSDYLIQKNYFRNKKEGIPNRNER